MAAERLQHAHCRPVLRCDVSHAAEMLLEGVLCPCDGGEQVGDECEVARAIERSLPPFHRSRVEQCV